LTKKAVFRSIESEMLGPDFIIIGMLVTDGEWHNKYADLFGRHTGYSAEMLGRLMEEMGTNESYLSVKREMVWTMVQAAMAGNNRLYANNNTIKLLMEGYIQGHNSWEKILRQMLDIKTVRSGIERGEYNEGLTPWRGTGVERLRNGGVLINGLSKHTSSESIAVFCVLQMLQWVHRWMSKCVISELLMETSRLMWPDLEYSDNLND
jgi:hypothetical protein